MIRWIAPMLVLVLLVGCVSNKTFQAERVRMDELQKINDELLVLLAYMNRDIERIGVELKGVDHSFQELDTEILDLKKRLDWIYENYAFTNRIDDLETYTDRITQSLELLRDDVLAYGFVPERLMDIDDELVELHDEFQQIEETVNDFLEKNRIAVANLVTKVELACELNRIVTEIKTQPETREPGEEITALKRETGEMKKQVQSLVTDMKQVNQQIKGLTQDVQNLIIRLEKPTPDIPIHVHSADKPATPLPQEYNSAKSAYDRRNWEQAIRSFEDFIAQNPHAPLAANAQYWMAESYYAAGNYRKALREFETVIGHYPSSPKAADAQVKIGLCYIKMNDLEMARTHLRQVRSKYPSYDRQTLVDSLLNRIDN